MNETGASARKYVFNSDGAIKSVFEDNEGVLFKYTLHLRTTGFYLITGTVSLLNPKTRKPMQVLDEKSSKKVPASVPINIRYPESMDRVDAEIDQEIARVCSILKQRHQANFKEASLQAKLLVEMTLEELSHGYLAQAKHELHTSASMQSRLSASVGTFASKITLPVGRIRRGTLLKAVEGMSSGTQKLRDLKKFVSYIESKKQISSGLLPLINEAINACPQNAGQDQKQRAARQASNSDVLSSGAEKKLTEIVRANKSNPYYVAMGSSLGSGLVALETCLLKVEQVLTTPGKRNEVFLAIKRNYISATQDYTFPIFPQEAELLNDYMSDLKRMYGSERLSEGKYLFSVDDGTTPIDEKELKRLCREQLQLLKFGYADLIENVDLQKDKGYQLLINTYRNRLELCGLTRATDDGAYSFMLHQSLGSKVQADHYRGFTGESGRELLLSFVLQDPRYKSGDYSLTTMAIKKIRREINDIFQEVIYPKCDAKNRQQLSIELTILVAGAVIKFFADHGIDIEIVNVEELLCEVGNIVGT